MKACIIYYSKTGNNKKFAEKLCLESKMDLYPVDMEKSMASIVMDIIFKRTPKISVPNLNRYDFVLLIGPVWMQQFATPLRAVLKEIKSKQKTYGVMTVCGGALNPNPSLERNIEKISGGKSRIFKQYYTKDFVGKDQVKMSDTNDYFLNEEETIHLVEDALLLLQGHLK